MPSNKVVPELKPCPYRKRRPGRMNPERHPERHVMKIYANDSGFQVYCEACQSYEKTQPTVGAAIEAWNRRIKGEEHGR